MKKIFLLLFFLGVGGSASAMIRAGVDVGPDPVYSDDDYYYGWYGPGVYYGTYYSDYPTYYAWQRRHYYGGPYYWRHNHWDGHGHGHHHGGHHGGHGRHH